MPTISEQIHAAGQSIAQADATTLAGLLNGSMEHFITPAFGIVSGHVLDRYGLRTADFASVIYATFGQPDAISGSPVPADNAAAVIDAAVNMDLDTFRAAYARIAQAKTLKKATRSTTNRQPSTTITLGIIFALKTTLPLETFAEELNRLNSQTPSHQWPDMIVFASAATINYTVQFPTEHPSGDFLPPAEGATQNYVPAVYVQISMRPTGGLTFNRMMAFLIAHLNIFNPMAVPINFMDVLEGVPKLGISFSGYQFNLAGQLKPVPENLYNDRHLPPSPLVIESQGKLLATIQFLPWQDGGVVLLNGVLPLEGILIFMGKRVDLGGISRPPSLKMSNVLPIAAQDFNTMLVNLQSRSNMRVRPDTRKRIMQKISDEGTTAPFVARLFLGIMRLRDLVFDNEVTKNEFDTSFDFVHSNLLNARTSAEEIEKAWNGHRAKIDSGEIIKIQGQNISISESIDRNLKRDVESFLNAATRSLKGGMDKVAKKLDIDIGFLFAKQATFEREIVLFEQREPVLAIYIRQTRVWSEPLILCRNNLEHNSTLLSRVEYVQSGQTVTATEPRISDQPVTEFTKVTLNHLSHFIEDIIAYCLQKKMPQGLTITEIPLRDRVENCPERFIVTTKIGGKPEWSISFSALPFDGV
jgi:hypothetical protein